MKLRSLLLTALVVLPLAVQPPRAVAQDPADPQVQGFDRNKFWDYALCGASIAFASGTGGWVFAFVVCGKVATDHWID